MKVIIREINVISLTCQMARTNVSDGYQRVDEIRKKKSEKSEKRNDTMQVDISNLLIFDLLSFILIDTPFIAVLLPYSASKKRFSGV